MRGLGAAIAAVVVAAVGTAGDSVLARLAIHEHFSQVEANSRLQINYPRYLAVSAVVNLSLRVYEGKVQSAALDRYQAFSFRKRVKRMLHCCIHYSTLHT